MVVSTLQVLEFVCVDLMAVKSPLDSKCGMGFNRLKETFIHQSRLIDKFKHLVLVDRSWET